MRREKWLGQNGKYAAGTIPLMLLAALLMVALPAKGQFPSYHIDFDVYWTGARYFLDGGYVYGEIPTSTKAPTSPSPTHPSPSSSSSPSPSSPTRPAPSSSPCCPC